MPDNDTPTNGTTLAINEPQHAPAVMTDAEINGLFRIANALALSGMFKDALKAEQAFAKMLIGRDLGLSPTQAMMGINIIEGKPELSANLQAAFVKRTPGYDYRVTEHTTEACEITFYRDGEPLGTSRFTMEDAKTAGLAGRGPWKSYPKNMLYARAMSNGVAFHCPEVTGGVKTYSDGEISGAETVPTLDSQGDAEAPEQAVPDANVNPVTGEILPDAIGDGRLAQELTGMVKALVDAKVWTGAKVKAQLVAAGARTTESVSAAVGSLSAVDAADMRTAMTKLLMANPPASVDEKSAAA